MGHCKVKCSFYCVKQVWSGLHWGLRQECCAGGLWGLWFCLFIEFFCRGRGSTQQPQRTEPCQCVSDQTWAYHGALQGQMQPLQCTVGVIEPALGAAARLGRWFVGVAVLLDAGFFQLWRRRMATTAALRALSVCVL